MMDSGELSLNNQHAPDDAMKLLLSLQNRLRMELLAHLANAERSVAELAESVELDASSVSHALARLRAHKLVQHRADKQRHFYSLTKNVRATVNDDETVIRVSRGKVEITIRITR